VLDKPRTDFVGFTIEVDGRVHSAAVVARTCYALAELGAFSIGSADQKLIVTVIPSSALALTEFENRFRRELIDFTVRADIEEKTSHIRTLIWQTAFAEASPRDG
jgi:His-Xaa-Ser system protein HxsD